MACSLGSTVTDQGYHARGIRGGKGLCSGGLLQEHHHHQLHVAVCAKT